MSSLIAAGLIAIPAAAGIANAATPPATPRDSIPQSIASPQSATMGAAFGDGDAWQEPTGLAVSAAAAETAARRTGRRWEATAARTETTKLYVNPDGTRTVVASSGRMHVQRPEGWIDLDTTLHAVDGVLRPAAIGADVAFSTGGDGPLVRMRDGATAVEIGWNGRLPAPEVTGDVARYRDVTPGVDILVRATPEGFEHSVVLTRRPAAAPVVRMPLRLTGVSVDRDEQGSLRLVDAKGSVVAQAASPTAFDSAGTAQTPANRSPRTSALATGVETGANGPELVLRPDAAFLGDPEVTYPVTLDPTWRRGRDSDVWVQQGNTAWQGASPELRLGNFSGSVARFYVTFELSALTGKSIQSATMKLYNYSSSCAARGVNVYQVLSGWDPQTITWSGPNQPSIATTATTSRTFAHSIYDATCPPPDPDGYEGFTLTSLASQWAAGTAGNYGVQLRASSETDTTATKRFWSGDSSDSLKFPLMEVTYTEPDAPAPAGLGFEPWWSYVSRRVGPQSTASVNVANGNLVVQATDSSPVQAHGRLAYVLRRTYNSDSYNTATLPGGIGAGWLLNVGEVVGTDAADIVGTALDVPTTNAFALTDATVTLVDRDGTRHTFRRKSDVRLPVSSLLGTVLQPLSTAVPSGFSNLCLEVPYQAPAGVHLSLWRYIAVHGVCGQYDPNSVVTGFVTMRPDRLRGEYNALGKLVSLRDGSGVELRYTYDTLTNALQYVYEPRSCSAPSGVPAATCRAFRFDYSVANRVRVTDPAGRATDYWLRTAGALTVLDHVTDPSTVTAGEWRYAYQGDTYNGQAVACGAPTGALCFVGDPRASVDGSSARTTFAYSSGNVMDVNDRRQVSGNNTHLTYSGTHTVVDQAGHQQVYRFHEGNTAQLDPSGRVHELDEGATPSGGGVATSFLRVTTTLWDGTAPARACRTDNVVDNDVCETVRVGGSDTTGTVATPDSRTQLAYDDLGNVLRVRRFNTNPAGFGTATPATLDTTFAYRKQYRTPSGTSVWTGNLTGGGQASDGGPSAASPAVGDAGQALYAVSDLVQSLPPRGNTTTDTTQVQALRTNYTVLGNTAQEPSTTPATTQTCASGSGTSNSGLVCRVEPPAHAGADRSFSSYEFNTFGERTLMRTPKSRVEVDDDHDGLPDADAATNSYTYGYYDDSDLELSQKVSAGGWLKAVTDPTGKFVVFAYDRAGNVVRSWDRNATTKAGQSVTSYPGAVETPTSGEYVEARYNAFSTARDDFAKPWRYLRSTRNQLGDTTLYSIDGNGNPVRVTPPSGNAEAAADTTYHLSSYDITFGYDAADQVVTVSKPSGSTQNTYDAFGNRTASRDTGSGYVTAVFDAVNRPTRSAATRAASGSTVPPKCTTAQASDSPVAVGTVLCGQVVTYDGLDDVKTTSNNLTASASSDDELHTVVYNSLGWPIERRDPRLALVNGTPELRTQLRYDADGRVTDGCTPRLVTEGDGICDADSPYSTHTAYDDAGSALSSVTPRETSGSTGFDANTTRFGYDADGNLKTSTDARAAVADDPMYTVTSTYDLLDRLVSRSVPRDIDPVTNKVRSNQTTWEYDAAGNVLFEIRGAGTSERYVVGHTYDAAHRAIDTVDGLVAADTLAARQAAMASAVPDADGASNSRTRAVYDLDGNVTMVFSARAFLSPGSVASPSTRYMTRTDYDHDGRVIATNVPRYTPDDANTADASDSASTEQSSQCPVVNGYAGPAASTPANVGVCSTEIEYDLAGNASRVWLPTTATHTGQRYVDYAFSLDHLTTSVTSASAKTAGTRVTTNMTYDSAGRQRTVSGPEQRSGETQYTLDGLVRRTIDAKNRAWTVEYDANGDRTAETNPKTEVTAWTYYADGLLRDVTTPPDTGTVGDRTSYTYDAIGNTVAVLNPTGNGTEADDNNQSGAKVFNTYTFDSLLASTSRPYLHSGATLTTRRRTTFAYDAVGRKTSQTTGETGAAADSAFAAGATTQSFAYYPNNRLRTETGRAGETISRRYDADGNLIQAHSAPGAAPSPLPACPASGSICSHYYLDGLLRDTNDGAGRTTSFGYDGSGAVSSSVVAGGSAPTQTTYAHGDAGTPATMRAVIDGTARTWTYAYDDAVRAVRRDEPNGTASAWAYDTDDTLTSATLTATQPGPGTAVLASWSYTYDELGREDVATYSGYNASNDGSTPGTQITNETQDFDYYPSGRLKTFTAGGVAHAYSWDRDGNMLSGFTAGSDATYAYNADDSTATVTSGGVMTSYAYDKAGNTVDDGSACYSYDGFDRLTTTRSRGTGSSCPASGPTYTYDAADRQTTRTEGGQTTTMHYGGLGNAVVEEADSTTRALIRDPGGEVRAVRTGGATNPVHYLHTDGQGNVTAVTGASPSSAAPGLALLCTARFDAHGSPVSARSGDNPCRSGSTSSDHFYRGERRDPTTGNYQLGSRTYNPARASFLTPDTYRSGPAGADLALSRDPLTANRYNYVNGDPVNLRDPSGHSSIGGGAATDGQLREECRLAANDGLMSLEHCLESLGFAPDNTPGETLRGWGRAIKRNAPAIGTSLVLGGTCAAATAGVLALACIPLAGGAGGAVTGAQRCPKGPKWRKCMALSTAVSAAVATATAGALKGFGALGRGLASDIVADDVATTAADSAVTSVAGDDAAGTATTLRTATLEAGSGDAPGSTAAATDSAAADAGAGDAGSSASSRGTSVRGATASATSRGVSKLGGIVSEESTNAGGGRLITSVGEITQDDFVPYVERAMIRGDSVQVLTGAHGAADGSMIADAAMYADDANLFRGWPRVTIYDVTKMTPEEISAVLRGPGTTIGGFCNSAICLEPFK